MMQQSQCAEIHQKSQTTHKTVAQQLDPDIIGLKVYVSEEYSYRYACYYLAYYHLRNRIFGIEHRINRNVPQTPDNTEEDYSAAFKAAVKNKTGAIDMMMTHVSISVDGLVSEGMLRQFNDMPGIDLEADYWNHEFMDSLAIDDMYFLGFNDFNILYTHVIAFNKTILEKYDDNNDELISLIERRIFEQGFKLGAKLMLEVLCEDKKSA